MADRVDKEIKRLIKAAQEAEDKAAAQVIRSLAETRRDVAAAVASTDWQLYHLPQLKAAVERALNEFGRRFGVDLQEFESSFWEMGIEHVDGPLRTVGVVAAIPEIDVTALTALKEYGLDKVEGLTKDAIAKINNELSLGLMGEKQPYEVMKAVGRNLKDKSIFRSIMHRAETITRNETGRALEKASQLRKEAAAKVVPGLQKQWFYGHSPKMPRLDHLAAAGQVRDVDEPFRVGGEDLMFPRDPAGSASNTINCG